MWPFGENIDQYPGIFAATPGQKIDGSDELLEWGTLKNGKVKWYFSFICYGLMHFNALFLNCDVIVISHTTNCKINHGTKYTTYNTLIILWADISNGFNWLKIWFKGYTRLII